MVRSSEGRITELSETQERSLVEDPKLLLVGLLALSHWTAEEIGAAYRLTAAEVVRHLVQLDKLGIIDLLPGDRIKLRLARNFSWRKDGPLQQFFEARLQRNFSTRRSTGRASCASWFTARSPSIRMHCWASA